MSVDLNVWSDHKLDFSTFAEGLAAFESKTGKRLADRNFRTDAPLEETPRIAEIGYYADLETLKHNFKRHRRIRIFTNFAFCGEISLYGKTVNFHPRGFYTRFTRWKKLVAGDLPAEDAEPSTIFAQYRANWETFRNFAVELTRNLGGTRLIYLADNLQRPEDEFREGRSLETGTGLMSELCDSYELEFLRLYPEEFEEKYAWFFEELDL
jgi:hypothetical protein